MPKTSDDIIAKRAFKLLREELPLEKFIIEDKKYIEEGKARRCADELGPDLKAESAKQIAAAEVAFNKLRKRDFG